MMKINWEGSNCDYTATAGDYTLRVEKLDTGVWWWWCMHVPSNTSDDGTCYGFTEAKAMAKGWMTWHSKQ